MKKDTKMVRENSLKIGLIANTRSGKNKFVRKGFQERLSKIAANCLSSGKTDKGVFFRPTSTLAEIPKIAQEFQKKKIKVIAIFGGDGTIQKVLTGCLGVYNSENLPPILILGGGTMNLVSKSLKMKGSPEDRLKKFLNSASGNNLKIATRKTIRVNGHLGFMYGLGLPCNYIEMYNEGGEAGPWKAIKMIFQVFISVIKGGEKLQRLFSRINGEFFLDGEKIPFSSITGLLAQTISNLAFGFHFTYRAFEKEGTCHLIATTASPFNIVLHFFHVLFRRPWRSAKIINDLASSFKIKPSHPCNYMLDGEIFSHKNVKKPISMDMGPVIKLIQPS